VIPAVGCHEKDQDKRESGKFKGGNKKSLNEAKDTVEGEPKSLGYCNQSG
jgi:hypothetical protein